MVSRYGVTKEGAVGVTVGVGTMHCLLPHCAPHHLSPHSHNPSHNHIHHHNHHNHHPPPSPSPHGHLSQLNHAQHQLTININNHQLQSQQTQHQQQAPPQYRLITASARSDCYVSGPNYGGQSGGQVGGGGNSVGAPGSRGPPPLGGIQNIGQSAAGIQQGGQTGAQQAPPQSQTPGVQSQQPQGPPPTTTPPVHTPSPQEMGKQTHLQAQPLQQSIFVTNQTRTASQVYYQAGARPQAPRNLNHRGGQGGGGAQVVGIQGVGGGGGQPTAMYQHHGTLPVPPGAAVYMQGQVPLHPSHAAPHQQPVYAMNSQMQPIQFSCPPQRHQGHQNQSFYQNYQPTVIAPNLFGYAPGPTTQHPGYFYAPPGTQINMGRAGTGTVGGAAPHVGSPLAGGQGATVVQQGTIQQPSQQPQPMPPMPLPLGQTEVYPGHNGGGQNPANSLANRRNRRRNKAILDIVDPKTGKNISEEIYEDDAATQSGDSSNRATPQPQNMEMIADFAARVAKAATDDSKSPAAPENPLISKNSSSSSSSSSPQTLSSTTNVKIQTNSSADNIDNNSQNNTTINNPPVIPNPNQSINNKLQNVSSQSSSSSSSSSSILVSSNTPIGAQVIDLCNVKPKEHKPLQALVEEFHPRNEIRIQSEEPQQIPVVINQEIISSQFNQAAATAVTPVPTIPVNELHEKITSVINSSSISKNQIQTHHPTAAIISSSNVVVPTSIDNAILPSVLNPVPSKEEFPTLEPKIPSNSPARRKSHNQTQQQHQQQQQSNHPNVISHNANELPSKEITKERKLSERNSSNSSRGTTPTPVINQSAAAADHHHHHIHNSKPNGDTIDKHHHEQDNISTKEQQQRNADGKAAQKQKKNRGHLKGKDLNRKGAEKEGTDMDAFVNAAAQPAAAKSEIKQSEVTIKQQQQQQQQTETKELSPQHENDTEKESSKDIIKEEEEAAKNITEFKKEIEEEVPKTIDLKIEQAEQAPPTPIPTSITTATTTVVTPEVSRENTPVQTPTTEKSTPVIPPLVQNNKESSFKETTTPATTPTIEETSRIEEVCKMPVKTIANDVVDHVSTTTTTTVVDIVELESAAIVAQKNEENAKISALRIPSSEEEQDDGIPVVEKDNENEEEQQQGDQDDTTQKEGGPPPLKYTYGEDQWSPLNKSGKKVYDREFLIKLQADPNSKIKPLNLPDLEVVLKDNSRSNRGSMDLRQLRDVNIGRHDSLLFPGFVKSSQSARGPLTTKRNSQQGKPKSNKPAVIHVSLSLREDVKLRETENAWKPGRLKPTDGGEEEAKTQDLYKRVRGVLNKLTPQKFATLVNQVRALQIDSQERLQGVIDLVFEKAVDEPSFSVAYALMCKELAMMQVSGPDSKAGKEESNVNFRKLIITRCQVEFEKNTVDENATAIKMKEIEACADPEKKKELQVALTEEERRIRIKSVGNIRFIGELFKQGMLTTNIMHRCIRHLMTKIDEESLECLCKLLSTIGKDLESKNQNLEPYFKQMHDIVNRKGAGRVSSRVRFMLQDVIELRLNKWIPRRDDSNPKTMDQIQKEAETERLDTHLNNTPLNTPRKDDRNNDRKRNRGGGGVIEEGGWSTAPVRGSRQQYSIEPSKLKNKPPPMDNLQLGNKNMFQWSRNVSADAPKTVTPNKFAMLENIDQDKRSALPLSGSRSTGPRDYGRPDFKSSYDGRNSRNGSQQLGSRSSSRDSSLHDSSRSQSMSMPPPQPIKSIPPPAPASAPSKPVSTMSEEQLAKKSANILEEYLSDTNISNAALEIRETFDNSTFANFVREALNLVVEKSSTARKQVSLLLTHLIAKNILPLSLYLAGLGEVLDMAEDLVIDIPKIWVYLAELIWYPLAEGVHPFSELKTMMAPLKSKGLAGKLMGELMITLVQEKSPKWIKDKWDQAGLEWGDFLQENESLDDFIKKYKLEFLFGDSNSGFGSLSGQLSMEQIQERLRSLMSNEKENSFDNICSWISANVGERASEPQFIRVLMTAILEVSIEPYNNTWKFRSDKFNNLQTLISRYIDLNELLELQCLIAIQEYIHKLEHPSGVLLQIIEKLSDDSILSYDAFLAWESNKDPTALTGKSVAMMALTSFFTSLKEADDESSAEEA